MMNPSGPTAAAAVALAPETGGISVALKGVAIIWGGYAAKNAASSALSEKVS
jgi:hypothetical protein